MAMPAWNKLADEQKNTILKFFDQKKWEALDEEVKTRFAAYALISDVLDVPATGRELPSHRKWTLPNPEKETLADKARRSGEETYEPATKQTSESGS